MLNFVPLLREFKEPASASRRERGREEQNRNAGGC